MLVHFEETSMDKGSADKSIRNEPSEFDCRFCCKDATLKIGILGQIRKSENMIVIGDEDDINCLEIDSRKVW